MNLEFLRRLNLEFLRRRRVIVGIVLGVIAVTFAVGFGLFARRVGQLRAHRVSGPNWTFPSRVYSDVVAFMPGRWLPASYLEAQLAARRYRQTARPPALGEWMRLGDAYEIGLRGFRDPSGRAIAPGTVLVRLEGGRVASVERVGGGRSAAGLEPVLISLVFDEDRVWRTWIPLERIPQSLRDAVVSSEDRRFFSHLGVDLRGSLRALVANARSRQVRQGGSTITQQLARGLFLGRERTFARKFAEIPLAVGLELLLSKQQILEMYLNSVYWGQAEGFGVGGVVEASRWYFGVPAESLRVEQAATLAAMIPAPNALDPFRSPRTVLRRRNQVLATMAATGKLTTEQAGRLSRRPLGVRRGPRPPESYPSFTGYVRDVLAREMPAESATHSGLAIFTTLDPVWQERSERELRAGLDALDGWQRGERLQGAFVALEPGSAAVRAMVGGRVPALGDFNRATRAKRQVGSAVKPIVYATAFASGRGITPASLFPDMPRTFADTDGPWTPHNSDGRYLPSVTLAKALERSLNVATVNLVQAIGPLTVARETERFGLGRMRPVLSIGLGSGEASLLDLTNAYLVFADRGIRKTPTPIRMVVDRSGHVVYRPDGVSQRVLPAQISDLMTGLLQNVVRFGVAYPLRARFGFLRPVAGKTGTTDEYRDAWFVGFTPHVAAGIWVGYDRPRSIGRLSAEIALPIWARILQSLLDGFPPAPFATDAKLEWRAIDPYTGMLSDGTCRTEPTPFLPGTGPTRYCTHGPMHDFGIVRRDSLAADSLGGAGADSLRRSGPDTLDFSR